MTRASEKDESVLVLEVVTRERGTRGKTKTVRNDTW